MAGEAETYRRESKVRRREYGGAIVPTRGTQVLLARLRQLNPTTVFLVAAALVIGGLLAPRPFGGALLLVMAAALAALLTLTWGYGTSRTRVARVVILALLVALAVVRLV
ncbi:DUF6703 family protein [Planosporangium sp. 12N6]|uniref:DUF6703 family protein n=1 Tax=Planosporangium spinosum TaxID=3402278 RepID=UPI003CE95709